MHALGNADYGEKGWAEGLKGCEDPELTPGLPTTHSLPEPGRNVWSRFPEASTLGRLRKLSTQVLALLFAQINSRVPPEMVCLKKKKKNQIGEAGNLARKLRGEGLGGQSLSSKRTPVRTSKVRVICLHHSQSGLLSLSSFPPS